MLTIVRRARTYSPADLGFRDLLVSGGRIAAIEDSLPPIPAGIPHTEIDGDGLRVVPGLIDSHVHVVGGGGEAGPETRVPRIRLSHLTQAGITSCVGVLGTDGTTRTVRDLVATTLGLRADGLNAWCYTGSYRIPPPTLTSSIRDDIVFIDPIIGVGELALSDHRSSQPTLAEFLRVASDAYVAGLMAKKAGVVHCHMGSGERGFAMLHDALDSAEIPPRVYHPTHINRERWLFEAAPALAKRGCTVDLTAFPEDGETMSAAEGVMRWLDGGHPMDKLTCSSDGAGCLPTFDEHGRLEKMDVGRPITLLQTVQALLAEGVPLETFLPVFTSNVADTLCLEGRGRIRVGDHADLAMIDGAGRLVHLLANGQPLIAHGALSARGCFEGGNATVS
jgi:beta-aspartyl-dipeptidase (metallo-type)